MEAQQQQQHEHEHGSGGSDIGTRGTNTAQGDHLQNMNQPKTVYDDDDNSLGSEDLFDAPRTSLSDRPLLAAAKKAREQYEREQARSGRHLENLNQPATIMEEEESLGSTDLFDPPKGPSSGRPLLEAAKRARAQAAAMVLHHVPGLSRVTLARTAALLRLSPVLTLEAEPLLEIAPALV